jgi:hypothetical protein
MILTYEECNIIDKAAKKLAKRSVAEKRDIALEHDWNRIKLAFAGLNPRIFLNFIHFECMPMVQ